MESVVEVYVDGSAHTHDNVIDVGWAYKIVFPDTRVVSAHGNDVEEGFKSQRNVAGECTAVMRALDRLVALGVTYVTLYHDYEGLSKWVRGEWRAKNVYTSDYAAKVRSSGVDIEWRWVPGHSGIKGNEQVDMAAYAAMKGGSGALLVSTASFKMKVPDGAVGVSIARSSPADFVGKTIHLLTPSRCLLADYKTASISWEAYAVRYKAELEGKLSGIPGRNLSEKLGDLVTKAAKELNTNHLVLLCWESEGVNCHRRLIYNLLPSEIRGNLR